jgi:hypothetical protein
LNDVAILTRSWPLRFFGRAWKNAGKIMFFERVKFCVFQLLIRFTKTENDGKYCIDQGQVLFLLEVF